MATRDTGGQQRATRSREETDEVEASVDTDVAERQKELSDVHGWEHIGSAGRAPGAAAKTKEGAEAPSPRAASLPT